MNDYLALIENALKNNMPIGNFKEQTLIDSMNYSLKAGGKRIRPVLVCEFCSLCGGNVEYSLPYGCAVEMVHTYSLIHDDLPCMDDDDFRRGQPSNHKVFDEGISVLAGDALQSRAYEIMLNHDNAEKIGFENAVNAAYTLAHYSGTLGMVGGQVIDIENEGKKAPIETLKEMDYKKTAGLIIASCMIGCICANAEKKYIDAAKEYAESIGIAFQIVDDVLDVTASEEELGKPIGSDKENDKSTYVSLLGIDKCRELVDELTQKAIKALSVFEKDTKELEDFAIALSKRKK